MNRTAIAIGVSVAAISTTLAGTYWAFVTLATHFPAGRTLGMMSAALMVGSGLACVTIIYLANK